MLSDGPAGKAWGRGSSVRGLDAAGSGLVPGVLGGLASGQVRSAPNAQRSASCGGGTRLTSPSALAARGELVRTGRGAAARGRASPRQLRASTPYARRPLEHANTSTTQQTIGN